MKPLTCLIIDDERLTRGHLRRLAEAHPHLEVLGEAASCSEAVSLIRRTSPLLLLLDIQMPGGGGFAILDALEHPPAVIFVTAHEQHAIRAFQVNAVDYLLKPVSPERFVEAVERAGQRVFGRAGSAGSPSGVLQDGDLILCEIGHSGHFIEVNDILVVRSEGNYTCVTTSDGRQRIARQTLKQWAARLPHDAFVQIDRRLIVNRQGIRSVEFTGRSGLVHLGEKGVELPIGPAGVAPLRKVLSQ